MTYCISDIHGEYELFMRLMEKIGYSESDKLIVCGDLIDKGGSSVRLAKTVFALPNSYCIKGNHEDTFFKFYRTRMHSAMMDYDAILWHLQQYFPEDGSLLDWDTIDLINEMPLFHEEPKFLCVHAGIPLDDYGRTLPPDDVEPEHLLYDRRFKEPDVLPVDSKCVFFGHTPTVYLQSKAEILSYPKPGCVQPKSLLDYSKIHLDTGDSLTGVLGCYCVETGRTYYVTKQ